MPTSTKPKATRSPKKGNRAGLSETTPTAQVVQHLLDEHRLTQREVAYMTGADERSVRRWLANPDTTKIQGRYTERIDDLRHLVEVLGATLPGEQFGRWLRARNRYLQGARPLDQIAEGHYERVREAAEAYADGSYV